MHKEESDQNIIKIASRKSPLAKWQALQVRSLLNDKGIKAIVSHLLLTTADKIADHPLNDIGGKGLFTKEIDQAVIEGKAHLAVHSLKDIPGHINPQLVIGSVLKREDPRDALISSNMSIPAIADLPKNTQLATSSPRRAAQVKFIRPDIKIIPIRGNVETRAKKVYESKSIASLLAMAGIKRLGLNQFAKFPLPINTFLPAIGQGVVAILHRRNDEIAAKACKTINNFITYHEIIAERTMLEKINGNCNSPIAAHCKFNGKKLKLKAQIFSLDGKKVIESQKEGDFYDGNRIGNEVAEELLLNGAGKILSL
tara:strand:+ start:201 stop:1136 length:936 start_codon:yes stop_codon:yes gene_type:complete